MKNLFSFFAVLMLVFAMFTVPAMACHQDDPGCADATATGFYPANAYDSSYSSDYTFNDGAQASASGNAGGTLQTYANGECTEKVVFDGFKWVKKHGKWRLVPVFKTVVKPAEAYQAGIVDGDANPSTRALAHDHGLMSHSSASATFQGDVWSDGVAIGAGGNREWVSSDLYVNGSVYQNNYAAEVGYYAGGISGGNMSAGSFYASDYDYDSGRGFAHDFNRVDGSMTTSGQTRVEIDPYGSYRSINGTTSNMISVEDTRYLNSANVYGNGGLNGMINSRNGSFAGGTVDFSYNGGTYGAGNAALNAIVMDGSATVSGSSYATGNCDSCGDFDRQPK